MQIINWFLSLGFGLTALVSFGLTVVGVMAGIFLRNLLRGVFEPMRRGQTAADYGKEWGYVNLQGRNLGFVSFITLTFMFLGYITFYAVAVGRFFPSQ